MTLYKHNVLDEIACILPVDDRTRPELRVVRAEEAPPSHIVAAWPPKVVHTRRLRPREGQAIILEIVRAEPGISTVDVRRRLNAQGYERTAKSIHETLQKLERAGKVRRVRLTSARDRERAGARIIWEAL